MQLKKYILAIMFCLIASILVAPSSASAQALGAADIATQSATTDLGLLYYGNYRVKQELDLKVVKFKQPVQTAGEVKQDSRAWLYWEKKRSPKKGKYAILAVETLAQGQSYEFKYKTSKDGDWNVASFSVKVSPDIKPERTGKPKKVRYTNTYEDKVKVVFRPINSFNKKAETPVVAEPSETKTGKVKKGGTIVWTSYVWFRDAWIVQQYGEVYKVPN